MTQQRETVTDRLVSIIQRVQLERRTGVLTARRGKGAAQEEGTISFVKGQVKQANVGRRNGSEALNWLTTWSNCRFTFVPSNSSETTAPQPVVSAMPTPPEHTDPYLRTRSPLFARQTESLTTEGGNMSAQRRPTAADATPLPTAPYRTRPVDSALRVIENRGLSRTHRHLFLLIDGQRSISELVRLMGRGQNEVYELLHDLEQASVIQIVPYGQ
ncbi:MAG: hypothetical protein NVSMB33_04080 [Ktedonobacteraceae bacterium]